MIKTMLAALAAVPLLALSAAAQTWPTKPVTVIVSTAAGSGMSATARMIGDELEKIWKQSVIIDHRGGASGFIAAEVVGRTAPDGYTLLYGSDSFTAIKLFIKNNTFNPAKDLTPISLATWSPFLILTNPKLGPKTIEEFISLAKANPGKFNFGVIGRSQQTLEILRFSRLTGIKMEEITYQATAAALPQLMNNDLQFFLTSIASAGGQIKSGHLVALAAMGEQRMRELPDVPTLKERGIDQTAGFWFGFFGPPGLPKDLAEKISGDVRKALTVPELKAKLESQAYTVGGNSPGEFTRMIEAEMKLREEVARANNIQPE